MKTKTRKKNFDRTDLRDAMQAEGFADEILNANVMN